MSCEQFRASLREYVDDRMDGPARTTFRHHLRQCAACRRWAVAEEPSLLFALGAAPAPRPETVEACVSAVTARIRQERLERRLGERRQPWLAAAAAALVVVGAGVVWRLMPPPSPATLGVPPATVTAAEAPGPEKRTEPPRVDVDMPGEGIRIYQYAQEPDDDTAVYFIVNPAMES